MPIFLPSSALRTSCQVAPSSMVGSELSERARNAVRYWSYPPQNDATDVSPDCHACGTVGAEAKPTWDSVAMRACGPVSVNGWFTNSTVMPRSAKKPCSSPTRIGSLYALAGMAITLTTASPVSFVPSDEPSLDTQAVTVSIAAAEPTPVM